MSEIKATFIISLFHKQIILSIFFQKILAQMSHNVPAVYDVFAVAIKETVGFQQPQKCGGEKPHKGR
jgi:hypothetical protein